MSNVISGLAFGFIGGVIGFMIGGPVGAYYGAATGFAFGMAISPITPDIPSVGAPDQNALVMSNTVGGPIPDLAGTGKITGHLLCYGNESAVAQYSQSSGGGKGGSDDPPPQITGYKYYMSWVVGVIAGPVDTLYAIYKGEDIVWEGELDCPVSGGKETIVLTGMGSVDFYFGTADQIANSKVGALLDDATLNIPYRNMCWALFDNCYIGEYNRCPTIQFIVKKIPENAFSTKHEIQKYDSNPAHIAWYILHDLVGLPESWLHSADFAALASTLSNENRGMSVLFDRQQSALSYLESINAHIDNILRYGTDGKFHPKLIRDDYTAEDLPLIDEDVMLDEPTFNRKSWIDTINEMKVQYTEILLGPVSYINIGTNYWGDQSIDVYDGTIGFVGMTYEGDGVSDGIVSAIYDVAAEAWMSWGVVRDMHVHYATPNTCRISSSGYMAYYGSMSDFKNGGYWVDGDWTYSMRLYVFEEGEEPRYTDVWSCDWGTGIIPYECWDYAIYDMMDCIGDRISCLAYVQKIDGVTHDRWMVKTSEDAGLTFPTEYSFPALAAWCYEGSYAHKLRMTDDGTIWVVHLVNAAAPPYYLQLWKSTDGGASFTKIWETNYFTDNGLRTYSFGWDINDEDGKYQTISIENDPYTNYDRVFYVSDDYGVTFTTKTFISGSDSMYNTLVANKDYILVLSRDPTPSQHNDFFRSTDEATSFSFVDLEDYVSGISARWFDMQKNLNEIVTANGGDPYYTPPDWPESDFYAGVAYSNDGGVTWSVIQSPTPNGDLESDVFIPRTIKWR